MTLESFFLISLRSKINILNFNSTFKGVVNREVRDIL